MIPFETRKKAVVAKRGMYLRISSSFCRKDFPLIRLSGSSRGNDEQGAEDWREKKLLATDPQVEQ